MHLAIVTPYPPAITGIGQYGYHVSQALAGSGAFERISVLTEWRPGSIKQEPRPGMTVERVWRPDRLDAAWRILARLHELQPDLVWLNLGASIFGRSPFANLAGLLTPAAIRSRGWPSVATLHEMVDSADLRALRAPGGPLAILGARWITFSATRADVVCVTLRRNARLLSERWPALCVTHIPHGGFNAPEWLNQASHPELLIFTTFAPFKGLELLLEAFNRLHPVYPHLRLTIAGAEHPRAPGYLRRTQQAFGEHPAVRWLGVIPEAEIREVFRQATVVVLPYTATTGASSVLYRAAMWGRPVVASNLPELHAAVEEAGLQAEFFCNGDVDALTDALQALLADPERRQAQARHNFGAASRMTLEETGRAYLRAFDLALTTRHNPAQMVAAI